MFAKSIEMKVSSARQWYIVFKECFQTLCCRFFQSSQCEHFVFLRGRPLRSPGHSDLGRIYAEYHIPRDQIRLRQDPVQMQKVELLLKTPLRFST